ncbi:hypothetical protein EJB05_53282, partial [Eragrostis curvula]
MRNILLFVVGFIAIYLITTPTTAFPDPVDIDNPTIQEIGRWAVKEHVKKANDGIKFVKVVSGNKYPDLDLGTHYDLIIDALNRDGKDGKYEAEKMVLAKGQAGVNN